MRFGDFTYKEIKEKAVAGWLVVLPTGCTEQQGPHLPVDFDTWLAETVCLAAAKKSAEKYRVNALIMPAIPYGPTPEHRNYGSGYIHIPRELQENLVRAILTSLAEQGFKRVIIWRGCGEHKPHDTIAVFNKAFRGKIKAFLPDLPFNDIMQSIAPGIPGGHADSFSTSIALHLRPSAVRRDKIPPPENELVDWNDQNLDFTRYSSSGVIGDATQASAELGEKLWNAVVEKVALIFKEIAETKIAD